MIEVKALSHTYPDSKEPSVKNISFTVPDGTIFGFLGPSGAGKSTTQNLMTGLLKVQQGTVTYDGLPIHKQKQAFYNRIGVSFEHPNVYGKLTGLENLKYFAGLFSVPTEDPVKVLDWVGLKDSADKRASAYSKGMKQRLVFARALINRPSILFLDEPTSGLDPATAEVVKNIIQRKREEGCTIFLTTHNMYSADELCDTVAFLNDGTLVAMDTPRALKLSYGEASVEVEHRQNGGEVKKEILFHAREDHRRRLKELIDSGRIETLHSREASLEQIFIQLTGRSLA
ncbi:MAG: ABC transporter ATP-binding protein [Spirochaetales bacterium]|nr:ABC transporter ATP-binding protein [Spirochaetales bacterium]